MNISKNIMLAVDKEFPFIHFLYGDEIFGYAYKEATDNVKRLAKLSIEELANECANAENNSDRATCIIIEHILTTRLFKIQSTASWGAGILALVGVLMGYFFKGSGS
jgi:hypothetical protein